MTVKQARENARKLGIGRVFYDRTKRISERCIELAEAENNWEKYQRIGADKITDRWNYYEKLIREIEDALEKRGVRVVIDNTSSFHNLNFYPIDKWEKVTGKKYNNERNRRELVNDFDYKISELRYCGVEIL